jgi:serine/threonine-protein kinase RsbW
MFTLLTIPMQMTAKQMLLHSKRTIMLHENSMWLVVDSSVYGLSQIYQFMDLLKYSWSIDETLFENIHTAVSEAVTNAAEHGNKWDKNKSIYVAVSRDRDAYTFTVEDEGEGFNYRKIANPTDPENREKEGGRGIFIMNYLSDHIYFSENGKCVKLFFSQRK